MHLSSSIIASLALVLPSLALPSPSQAKDSVPGESSLFVSYSGKKTPLDPEYTRVIPATKHGAPQPDDLLFQNLLSAEWIIYSFYQEAVENFSTADFVKLGLPNTTYQRVTELRDNEAGHVRIFQDQISDYSLKPGPCRYAFGLGNSTDTFLTLQVYIEVSSMAFLTGLVREAKTNMSKSALMAIAEVETRHNVWSLIDVWNVSPFSGPADTIYPYSNQILDSTNAFVLPGSCPAQNPVYPSPRQNLPQLAFSKKSTTGRPGSRIQFVFSDPNNQPSFGRSRDYYAVFFHGVDTISVPFNPVDNTSTIPKQFDPTSIIIAVIADQPGAPTEHSVVAGPLIMLEQPGTLTLKEPNAV
ncbi:hypothetical protein N7474_008051 [Penicillium riverlandense]|uniref:uncharacterized protein n=1 Tax=Penicillium riverlandense TaxID=1903569 RepID=UPI002548EB62|nr:uncharacterized protein N7474_008051 [Penicillium riverlandense]KAJ5811750.1 hypothetical protein N7474_008051 [Penicillium riverlandense]